MATELSIAGPTTGSTVVAQIRRDSDEKVWCVTHQAFEVWDDDEQLDGNYDIELVEQGTSQYYVGDFPSEITEPGLYNDIFYKRTGSGPYAYAYETAGFTEISAGEDEEEESATGLNWISRSEYKTWAGISLDDTALNAKIDMLLPMISVAGNNYLGFTVKATDHVEVHRATGQFYNHRLRNSPVNTITQVTFNFMDADAQVIDGAQFYHHGSNLYWKPQSTSQPFGAWVKVEYNAGYTTVPADLKLAALLMLDAAIKRSDAEALVTEKSVKDIKIKYGAAVIDLADPIFAGAKSILDNCGLHSIPCV